MNKIIILLIIVYSNLFSNTVDTYIPKNAYKIIPDVHTENIDIGNGLVKPWYFDALIEHESCVRLKGNGYWARRCWNPKSELLTFWDKDKKIMRENGVGFFQLTRAFYKNGTIRFDTIRNLKRKYSKELKELTWDNVKSRPDLQIKAGLLLWYGTFKRFESKKEISYKDKIWFSDSIYNGGYKYFNRERKECMLRKNCNQFIWFNNVEKMNKRGNRILYGKRTAHDINRHHVRDVKRRMIKYKDFYKDIKICVKKEKKIKFVTGKED